MPKSSPASSTVRVSLCSSIVFRRVLTGGSGEDILALMFYNIKKNMSSLLVRIIARGKIEVQGVRP
jgi:hypothetical protein